MTGDTEDDIRLNQELQHLIQTALALPAKSLEYRRTMHKLLQNIQKSGKLGHPHQKSWSSSQYEDMYNEALSETLLYISQHLEQYNDRYPVMAWVNQVLRWRFTDVERRVMRQTPPSLKDLMPETNSSDDLIEQIDGSDTDRLRRHIETEPIYQETHIQGHPEVSFTVIFLMKMDGLTYQEIATRFNLKLSNVSTFFDRKLRKFSPHIRSSLQGE